MHIVIEIPNEYCTDNIVNELDCLLTDYFGGTVCKIASLPKGHGDLIDKNKLSKKKQYLFQTDNRAFPKSEWFIKADDLFSAKTIVSAHNE